MGTYSKVFALESRTESPEVGVCGALGMPPIDSKTGKHKFLPLYHGLRSAGLATRELDDFKAFLDTHGNERLVFSCDGVQDPEENALVDAIFDDGGFSPFARQDSPAYFTRYYRISCGDHSYVAEHEDDFAEIEPMTKGESDLEPLVNNVLLINDWETSFEFIPGLLDSYEGDMVKIRNFIFEYHPGPFKIDYLESR